VDERLDVVPPPEPLSDTVGLAVARNAAVRPDEPAIVEARRGLTMTWREYDAAANAIAGAVVHHPRGERVALQLPDGPELHAVMVGCERAGVVAVGIGARAGVREVEHLCRRTGARELLTSMPIGTSVLDRHRAFGPDELWYLNSTSGTTGLPKIVMHHQQRWFAFHEFADRVARFTPDDVFLSALPTPFGFGLWTSHFTPAITGAPCVVVERFTPEAVLDAIERHRVTVLAAVSTQFVMMLNSPAFDSADLSSLRLMFTGGEMVPYDRAKEFEERTGACVVQFYGSNETGALSGTSPDDPQEQRLRTAGRVIPEMHVRLLDVDDGGRGVPAGKGPTLCLGYWDDVEGNAQLWTADGWMRMGDLATIDDDGYLTVVGRTSDFVIRGGKNISTAIVEDAVSSHPAVALCAAVGMPDDVLGERVCAFVELRGVFDGDRALDLDALRAHLAARGTSKELWPERVIVVDALPRASGGKIAKGELRERARALRAES
jgi:acyl-CoA synthetase